MNPRRRRAAVWADVEVRGPGREGRGRPGGRSSVGVLADRPRGARRIPRGGRWRSRLGRDAALGNRRGCWGNRGALLVGWACSGGGPGGCDGEAWGRATCGRRGRAERWSHRGTSSSASVWPAHRSRDLQREIELLRRLMLRRQWSLSIERTQSTPRLGRKPTARFGAGRWRRARAVAAICRRHPGPHWRLAPARAGGGRQSPRCIVPQASPDAPVAARRSRHRRRRRPPLARLELRPAQHVDHLHVIERRHVPHRLE